MENKTKKRIMYHITNKKNVQSILKEGLIPRKPHYNLPKELDWKFVKGVYLTTQKSNYNSDLIVTLKIRISGLKLIKDKDPDLINSYYVKEIIVPERIILPKLNSEGKFFSSQP